ncbi:MAG TPA: Lrp/AsnC family transcriptional regulator [Nannocystaceae bacterium]|nr:Lrp/AsnC family transcriptional regulator [Nannocystaceae bacterium]
MHPNPLRGGGPAVPLDRIDFEILRLLQNDARRSNKELAAAVGLAPSSCLERVRRLEREGVILGAHARVDPGALGIALQAMIAVRLGEHSAPLVGGFMDALAAHPAVLAVFYISGATDFLIHVATSTVDELRALAVDAISARPEVAHVETSLVFDLRRSSLLPNYRGAAQEKTKAKTKGRGSKGARGGGGGAARGRGRG